MGQTNAAGQGPDQEPGHTGEPSTSRGEVVLYRGPDGRIELDVRLQGESLWLSQKQIAILFGRDIETVAGHLRNIFNEKELREGATTWDSQVVQIEGARHVRRNVRFYNLDAIISVGYRVNSKQGTQFRIWATGVLRDHLLKGYTVHQTRLQDLNQAVKLIAATASRRDLSGDEAKSLLDVVGRYNRTFELLDDYDHKRIAPAATRKTKTRPLAYAEASRIVARLRTQFAASQLFGIEKDKGLDAALGAIMQTAGGIDVYPSLEEKAAHLLYFLVKNHAFIDGNKRIAAALFLWFLELNNALQTSTGQPQITNATLVAITLMIAESHPRERNVLTRIVTHLLCDGG
ncbi:MAG: virulence protein RhuM/Fic/DOC family protein [Planctomycetes bacterium]|nr:virulence protein RhuM/Fic/DOC family protein [Planctomycetota bacterium]